MVRVVDLLSQIQLSSYQGRLREAEVALSKSEDRITILTRVSDAGQAKCDPDRAYVNEHPTRNDRSTALSSTLARMHHLRALYLLTHTYTHTQTSCSDIRMSI